MTDDEKQELAKLIHDLTSSDTDTFGDAFDGLARMGPKAAGAVDVLAAMLSDERRFIYRNHNSRVGAIRLRVNLKALETLADIGEPALPVVIGAHQHKSDAMRVRAAQALIARRRPVPVEHWARALSDSNVSLQSYAAHQLGESKAVAAIEPLSKGPKDDNLDVARRCAKSIGQIGSSKGIHPLIEALADARWKVGYAAGDALAAIGPPAAEAVVARFATVVLGVRRIEEAVPGLIRLLDDPDRWCAHFASDGLRNIGTDEARKALATHENETKAAPK